MTRQRTALLGKALLGSAWHGYHKLFQDRGKPVRCKAMPGVARPGTDTIINFLGGAMRGVARPGVARNFQ